MWILCVRNRSSCVGQNIYINEKCWRSGYTWFFFNTAICVCICIFDLYCMYLPSSLGHIMWKKMDVWYFQISMRYGTQLECPVYELRNWDSSLNFHFFSSQNLQYFLNFCSNYFSDRNYVDLINILFIFLFRIVIMKLNQLHVCICMLWTDKFNSYGKASRTAEIIPCFKLVLASMSQK